MEIKRIKIVDQLTTSWSGGETTEIYIYPENSSYTKRNFDFRLSTATVAVETTVFTPLNGVKRTLLVLAGEMELEHEGHHTVLLKPLEADCFEGGWRTTSKGKCIDFNLMTRKGVTGSLKGVESKKSFSELFLVSNTIKKTFLYLFSGSVEVVLEDEKIRLAEKEALFMHDFNTEKIVVNAIEDAVYVWCEIG